MTDSDLDERRTSIRQRNRFDVICEDDVVEDPLPAITSNGNGSKQLAKETSYHWPVMNLSTQTLVLKAYVIHKGMRAAA